MLAAGTIIEKLRIDVLLGRGAMGEVYRGEQMALRRPVAIKRIAPHLVSDPQAVARFEREARCIAALNHPHVVGIYDIVDGADDQGDRHLLLVMELIEGGVGLERLFTPMRDWRAASSVILQVAEGLDAAHSRAVVHRDIKPHNILIAPDGMAKVADFGLARSADTSALTTHGQALGTPYYMAPEVCEGSEAGPAADIYSLGATWYHLLTGRPPHQADSALALMRAHCDHEPPALTSLAADIPPPIAALVHACLDKEPHQRPADGRALVECLRSLQADGLLIPERIPDVCAAAGLSAEPATAATEIAGGTVDATAATRQVAAVDPALAATLPTARVETVVPLSAEPAATTGTHQPSPPSSQRTLLRVGLLPGLLVLGLGLGVGLGLGLANAGNPAPLDEPIQTPADDPVADAVTAVHQALAAQDFGLALTVVGSLVISHPDDSRAIGVAREVIAAEQAHLLAAQRYADARERLRRHAETWVWFDPAHGLIAIGISEADELAARARWRDAESAYLALRETYPTAEAVAVAHVLALGAGSEGGVSGGAVQSAWWLATQEVTPSADAVAATLLAALPRAGSDSDWALRLQAWLLANNRSDTLSWANAKLAELDERPELQNQTDHRIAFRVLDAADSLDDGQRIRFHLHLVTTSSGSYRQAISGSLTWLSERAAQPDWDAAKAAAQLPAVTQCRVFTSWGSYQDAAREQLAAVFYAELRPLMVQWAMAEGRDAQALWHERWHAWQWLAAADDLEDIDQLAFHAITLQVFDPQYNPADARAALIALAQGVAARGNAAQRATTALRAANQRIAAARQAAIAAGASGKHLAPYDIHLARIDDAMRGVEP